VKDDFLDGRFSTSVVALGGKRKWDYRRRPISRIRGLFSWTGCCCAKSIRPISSASRPYLFGDKNWITIEEIVFHVMISY
jgi:hypothetical protein